MTFAAHFPANCPPTEAQQAHGTVYRIVKSDPPAADDFSSHHETGKLPKVDACMRCGLSVFRTRDDGIHQRNSYPRLGDYLASGELHPTDGQTLLTTGKRPTHTTWWPCEGTDRARPFVILEKIS